MKKILYVGLIVVLMGCETDVLDIEPTNMISEEAVKKDPALVDAFLNKIYEATRFHSGDRNGNSYGGGNSERNMALLGVVAGEMMTIAAWQQPFATATQIIDAEGAGALEYWPYNNIRSANEILEILEEASFDEEMVEQKSAEARWLRAFMYFELVKRYGGVPLITEPQSIDQPIEELNVPRNTEKEIYDFIASEMDELVDILEPAPEFGRASKWAAYALKSRAMLYAGSIAKYGSVQLDGLVGIPGGEANSYYQKAYDAAMEVIENSPHTLYRENPDPVENYSEIFVKDANSEVIFAEIFDRSLLKVHSWSAVSMPDELAAIAASNHHMYLEVFEKYEYQDGSSGQLNWDLLDGNTKFDLDELVLQKDPRFKASAFYPEAEWQDGTAYFHKATVGTIPEGSDMPRVSRPRNRRTGFLVRKKVDESLIRPKIREDDTDLIVFRTGEMYLNAAEAAFEMGNMEEAKRLVNIIRERAGMPEKDALTIEDIRNERFVELYNEEHRYWDIRRWRIAVEVLNNKGFHGVEWVYYADDDKYTMELITTDFGRVRSFSEENYYLPIGLYRRANNPNLVENPGY